MQDVIIIILLLGLLATLPFVPGMRPIAKKVVVGSLTLVAATATAAAVASEQWKDIVAEAQAERDAQGNVLDVEPETITISLQ